MIITVMAARRKELKMTQHDLATKVGCTQAEISMAERGKTTPRVEILEKVAEVLSVPSDQLLDDYVEYRLNQERAS